MFKLFDLNMKEIQLPDGVVPLEIIVDKLSRERITDDIPGMFGVVDYGFSYRKREVKLSFLAHGKDETDKHLLEEQLSAFFDDYDEFLVARTLVPSRVLRIHVNEVSDPERFNVVDSLYKITGQTMMLPFWTSMYTTKELNDTGYSALVEKYGLVDSIHDDYTKYKFMPSILNQNIGAFTFKRGFINSTTGVDTGTSLNHYLVTDYIFTEERNKYSFLDTGNNSDVLRWWIYEYDADKNYIGSITTSNKKTEFTARGEFVRFMVQGTNGVTLNPSDITSTSTSINPKLSRFSRKNTFSVWNGGNVAVEPESMYLEIIVTETNGSLEILNKTTNEIVTVNASHGGTFDIKGVNMRMAALPVFRDSNKKIIRIAPGKNDFEINGQFTDITIDFRFYYK